LQSSKDGIAKMATDWLNMPELPRDVLFPSMRRRFWVCVLFFFTLSSEFILWDLFQQTIVKVILWVTMSPFTFTRWVIEYVPPFEGTPGPSGQRLSYGAMYWDHASSAVHETSQLTLGQLNGSHLTFIITGLFYSLATVNLQVWLFKKFRMAQMNVTEMNFSPPLLWWRAALSTLLNVVALYTAFMFVHSRLTHQPTGDSRGGVEAFLYMLSETLVVNQKIISSAARSTEANVLADVFKGVAGNGSWVAADDAAAHDAP
jgi:hypothetical protein